MQFKHLKPNCYEKYLDLRRMNSVSNVGYYMRNCRIHRGYQLLVIIRLITSRQLNAVDYMSQIG